MKTITLEKENYKIDSTGWKEIEDQNGVKVKENPEGDIWEYLEGDYKGEQLFTRGAVERLGIKDKLPTHKQIEELIGDDYKKFLEDNDIKFCGWRNQSYEKIFNIDEGFDVWCEDGSNFYGSRNEWNHNNDNGNFGFSVRCIQGLDSLDSTVGLFDSIIKRAEDNGAKLGAKAGYELGKILNGNQI